MKIKIVKKELAIYFLIITISILFYFVATKVTSLRNLTLLVLGIVALQILLYFGKLAILKAIFFVSAIPVVPAPLRGIPLVCIFILVFLISDFVSSSNFAPGKKQKSSASRFLLIILLVSIILAALSSLNSLGAHVDILAAWILGLLFIWKLISSKIQGEFNTSYFFRYVLAGQSLVLSISPILYFFPSVKLPGLAQISNSSYSIYATSAKRYSGIFPDYELYATYCLIAILFALSFVVLSNEFDLLASITLLLAIVQLLLSGTRSSIVLSSAGVFLVLINGLRLRRIRFNRVVRLLSLSIGLTLFFTLTLGSLLRISGLNYRFPRLFENSLNVLESDRIQIWSRYTNQISDSAFQLPRYVAWPIEDLGSPHSLPITLILSFGLIPTTCFFVIFLRSAINSFGSRDAISSMTLPILYLCLFLDQLKVEGTRQASFWIFVLTLIAIGQVSASSLKDNQHGEAI